MTDIEIIQAELRKFNQERDWDQFHNGKDLAVAISIELVSYWKPSFGSRPKMQKLRKSAKNWRMS